MPKALQLASSKAPSSSSALVAYSRTRDSYGRIEVRVSRLRGSVLGTLVLAANPSTPSTPRWLGSMMVAPWFTARCEAKVSRKPGPPSSRDMGSMDKGCRYQSPRRVGCWDARGGAESVTLKLENRFDSQLIDQMREAGHNVEVLSDFASTIGHAGAIVRYPDGKFEGATDPRSDGAAIGSKKNARAGQCSGSWPERLGRKFFRAVHSELGCRLLDRGERQTQTFRDRFVGQSPAIDIETRSKVRILEHGSKSLARQR